MNSLDELFADALDREAASTTQERRAAVAEVTVRGARRRRRVRATVQVAATVAVVGLGVAAGAIVMGGRDASPANPTPAPSRPAPSASPAIETVLDVRFPQAPLMTSDEWVGQDGTWDAEFASFENPGGADTGSSVALYLTAPGGERRLAFATVEFPVKDPMMLAFDWATRGLLVYDDVTKQLGTVDVITGQFSQISWQRDDQLVGAWPLGRALGGDGYVLLQSADAEGNVTDSIFAMHDGVGTSLQAPGWSPSPVWVMDIVTHTEEGLALTPVFGDTATTFAGTQDCTFRNWNTDGTFDALCGVRDDSAGDLIVVDPGTGGHVAAEDPDAPVINAIDATRTWMGMGTSGWGMTPPVVDNGDGTSSDLGDGFVNTPDSYAVIFGAR
jgi:hypothetical protein